MSLGIFQTDFQNNLILPSLTPQTAILGLYEQANDNYNLLSHTLLIFKYVSREKCIIYRYFYGQLNESKEKGEGNKPCYQQ